MGEKAILYELYTSSTRNTFLLCLLNRTSPRRTAEDLSEFLYSVKFSAVRKSPHRFILGLSVRSRRCQNNLPARSASCNPPPSRRIRTYLCCFDSAPDPLQASAGISPRFSLSAFNLICPPLGTSIPNWYILIISRFGISHERRSIPCTKSCADFCRKC